ncbi:hypothetical protein [Serratia sp. Ag2]|uniref:hypothetical protein n=1 Tax=Serratia sp. Ag2 TaxID=1532556 RepID=UPI0006919B5F|nr:hypothetical protein [Serratia sp. Ag2]
MILIHNSLPAPLFAPGKLTMTCGIAERVQQGVLNPLPYLSRHLAGDWGEVCEYDYKLNQAALNTGDRLHSVYQVTPDLTIWIITESDRSVTTVLLPSEY